MSTDHVRRDEQRIGELRELLAGKRYISQTILKELLRGASPDVLESVKMLLHIYAIEVIDDVVAQQRDREYAALQPLRDKIDELLKPLSWMEREILKLRYRLNDGYEYTREEVAAIFKMSLPELREVERQAVQKLQRPSTSHSLDEFRDALSMENPATTEGEFLRRVLGTSAWATPSFFDYATTERSQDAFISWLIAWAHRAHRETDAPLHKTGVYFLNKILSMCGLSCPREYERLTVWRYEDIDILVLVNQNIVLLVEDKVYTRQHSQQLERYLALVRSDFQDRKPAPIYLKTGDQRDYTEVEVAGWKGFLRADLLDVMEYGLKQGVTSDLFRAFHARLKQMEEASANRWQRLDD